MNRFPLEALVAIVERETQIMRGALGVYGEFPWDPRTPAYHELERRREEAAEAEVK